MNKEMVLPLPVCFPECEKVTVPLDEMNPARLCPFPYTLYDAPTSQVIWRDNKRDNKSTSIVGDGE